MRDPDAKCARRQRLIGNDSLTEAEILSNNLHYNIKTIC